MKLVTRFCCLLQYVKVKSFGIESVENLKIDAALGVDHAFLVYDSPTHKVHLDNYLMNAGGGGTRKDLTDTSSLHGLNLTISSPTTLTIGNDGLLKRNTLQY